MSVKKALKLMVDKEVQFADLRFTDTRGKEQHVSFPARIVNEKFFRTGRMFDGSSISGWKPIDQSDMLLMPDPATAVVDPFFSHPTLSLRCDVLEPATHKAYVRDPRSLGRRAEKHLLATGIADEAWFGPEPEFFIFDSVNWSLEMGGAHYEVKSDEGSWADSKDDDDGYGTGHRPSVKGGYFPVPPVDSLQDIRSGVCEILEKLGVVPEVHHHEVGTGGQCEIGTRFDTLVRRADMNQILKYVVLNVANDYGKTATFMPKPLVGENGSGMHVHVSMSKKGKNIFHGKEYAGLSKIALHFIAGIFEHAQAVNAFTNAGTNSYKRLVPGFEAPVNLAYSQRNRSAAIRVPLVNSQEEKRVEVRFPDSLGNPYLTFASILMAGLDGIERKLSPGKPADVDLYDLSKKKTKAIPSVCSSLSEALGALDRDRDFLKKGNVFSDDLIDGYIALKMEEINRFRAATHPLEFELYYSC